MLGVVCSSVGDVVQHFLAVETISLCNGKKTYGSEGALGIDEEALAFATSHVDGELHNRDKIGVSARVGFGLLGGALTWHVTASVWHS